MSKPADGAGKPIGVISRVSVEYTYFRFLGGPPVEFIRAMKSIAGTEGTDVFLTVLGFYRQNGNPKLDQVAPFLTASTIAVPKTETALLEAFMARDDFISF